MVWLHQNFIGLCKRYKCLMRVKATAVLRSKPLAFENSLATKYKANVIDHLPTPYAAYCSQIVHLIVLPYLLFFHSCLSVPSCSSRVQDLCLLASDVVLGPRFPTRWVYDMA